MIIFPTAPKPSASYGMLQVPIARVDMQTREGLESIAFLIDSGSDLTIVSKDLGLRIGWSLDPGERLMQLAGITGGSSFAPRELDLIIGEFQIHCRVAWAQNSDVTNVLGRVDIFDFFNIEFRQSERKTLLRRAQSKSRKNR